MPDSAIVVVNPRAAGGRAARLCGPIETWLARHAPGTALLAAGPDEIRARLAERSPGGRVVLVGGDGSVHRLLPDLLAGGLELGLVPVGTGNDFARALGVFGLGLEVALARALQAPAVPCDAGELRTQAGCVPFASSLSAGFDAAVSRRALAVPGWLGGMPRYLLATLAELVALKPCRIRVRVDGRLLHEGEALFAACLNTPSYGSGMPIAPAARIDDGALDAVVAGRFGRAGALAMLPRLLLGRHLGHPRVRVASFGELEIAADAPIPVAADGEPLGETVSLSVRVLPGALRVVR
jgi:diacylglycerol kinase family enzyme